jgi:mevalonate kinase
MEILMSAGALAVKPTGSGGGGHVISYWAKEPPSNLGFPFIKLEI